MNDEPATSDGERPAVAGDGPERRDFTYTSRDGLKLFARDVGPRGSTKLPVVCLAGLTRTSRDFETLAVRLATDPDKPRRVVSFDYRGRGLSDRDKDPANYNPVTEMNDVVDGMTALGIPRAIVIGTSRGGIIAMLMGVARPASVAALVLNDIGPAIEPLGLARIKAYVGRTPLPDDWADAARIQQRLHGAQFTALDEADWAAFARLTYRDTDGGPSSDYDPALGGTFEGVEFDRPVPTMWDEFAALKTQPLLVIRGENSDLLSAETVAQMKAAHPDLEAFTAAGEGHPPQLDRGPTVEAIAAFMNRVDG